MVQSLMTLSAGVMILSWSRTYPKQRTRSLILECMLRLMIQLPSKASLWTGLTVKYLGTANDSKLTFTKNCEAVCEKGHQRLACLRKLSCFYIDKKMLTLFYPRCSGKPGLLVKTVPTLYRGISSSFIQVVGSWPLRVKQSARKSFVPAAISLL